MADIEKLKKLVADAKALTDVEFHFLWQAIRNEKRIRYAKSQAIIKQLKESE